METKRITVADVAAQLRTVAEREARRLDVPVGDVKYHRRREGARCMYVHEATDEDERRPGCIVGQWLHYEFDVDLDELARYEGESAKKVVSALEERQVLELPGELDEDVLGFLDSVQGKQDTGCTWLLAIGNSEAWWSSR